jgi:hypothetical protein
MGRKCRRSKCRLSTPGLQWYFSFPVSCLITCILTSISRPRRPSLHSCSRRIRRSSSQFLPRHPPRRLQQLCLPIHLRRTRPLHLLRPHPRNRQLIRMSPPTPLSRNKRNTLFRIRNLGSSNRRRFHCHLPLPATLIREFRQSPSPNRHQYRRRNSLRDRLRRDKHRRRFPLHPKLNRHRS